MAGSIFSVRWVDPESFGDECWRIRCCGVQITYRDSLAERSKAIPTIRSLRLKKQPSQISCYLQPTTMPSWRCGSHGIAFKSVVHDILQLASQPTASVSPARKLRLADPSFGKTDAKTY
jgi:hypothetical protein